MRESAWAPLSVPAYRTLWIASVTADIGSAMHSVGAGWLMTTLSPSPLVVALVQVAAVLPMFLLLLPAGALADIVDRRRLLILGEGWSLVAATLAGTAAWMGWMTPGVLIALTFALAIGSALSTPALQAIVPEMVPKEQLTAAVGLSSMGINIARALGPAIAGIVVASFGVAAVFFLNAASFLATIYAIWSWKRPPRIGTLPPEHFGTALRAGWSYTRENPQFRAVLVRSAAFVLFASALWALLPLVGKQKLGGSAYGYSILLSCFGLGAVASAVTLPRARSLIAASTLPVVASLAFAAAMAVAALSDIFALIAAAMLPAGWAWLALIASLNIATRFTIADWVMARGLAVNQVVFFGCMAAGAAIWGEAADATSVDTALLAAAAGMVIAAFAVTRFRIPEGRANLDPTDHWAEPQVAAPTPNANAAVLVTVEYRVAVEHEAGFLAAMPALKASRRRNGARAWYLYRDLEHPERYVEHFLDVSWLDHLRHHHRTTAADKHAEDEVLRLVGAHRPRVSHFTVAP